MLQNSGTLIHEVFLKMNRTVHPILLRHGINQETLDEWSHNVDEGQFLAFRQLKIYFDQAIFPLFRTSWYKDKNVGTLHVLLDSKTARSLHSRYDIFYRNSHLNTLTLS
jgi:hypothetical protein